MIHVGVVTDESYLDAFEEQCIHVRTNKFLFNMMPNLEKELQMEQIKRRYTNNPYKKGQNHG